MLWVCFGSPIVTETIFVKTANTKSDKTPSKPSCSVRTDGRTDMIHTSHYSHVANVYGRDNHRMGECVLDLSGSGYGKFASCCDDANEH
jgi:hypothetical protein